MKMKTQPPPRNVFKKPKPAPTKKPTTPKLAAGERRLVRVNPARPDADRMAAYAAKLGVSNPNAQQRELLARFAFTLMPRRQLREMLADAAD